MPLSLWHQHGFAGDAAGQQVAHGFGRIFQPVLLALRRVQFASFHEADVTRLRSGLARYARRVDMDETDDEEADPVEIFVVPAPAPGLDRSAALALLDSWVQED